MTKVIDRRGQPKPTDDVLREAQADIQRDADKARTTNSFFGERNLQMLLTRQQYLNLRASEEYSRRNQRPLARLWQWLRGAPPPPDICGAMADAHARSLEQLAGED
jgi:hypothetical protein